MNYSKIIEKSWSYIWHHRFLWWLGILAVLTEGGSGWGSSGSGWSSGDAREVSRAAESIGRWVGENLTAIAVVLITLFFISLIVFYISYSARAGVIHSVNFLESENEKKITFCSAFKSGQKYFWRMLGATILIALIVFAAIVILAALGIGLFSLAAAISEWLLILAAGYLFLAILAVVLLVIYLNFILNLGYRHLVAKNCRVVESLKSAQKLLHRNLAPILISWLIQLAIGVVAGIILMFGLLVIGGILVAIGVGVYFVAKWTGVWIYASAAVLLCMLALWFISGVLNAYFSTFWTLVWRELVYNKKQ